MAANNTPKRAWNNVLYRDACLESIGRRYPDYAGKLRHDFDLFALGSYTGPESRIASHLDTQLRSMSTALGSEEAALEMAKQTLDRYITIVGLKPTPNTPDAVVYIRPIPDCDYSVRLWLADDTSGEVCMDFVHNETKQPVNSPFEYELWAMPSRATLWNEPALLASLESSFGAAVLPGEEKFVMSEGQTCVLKRPGHQNVQFTVPRMARPTPENVHVLNFSY
ncbi:hypothetical protein K466DRAFT_667619 [Polyporus arcularius HHB13444]|uniref:Uncharacterized protein n=1 Tax=Polyporus arcularius HHB13444 TaxID=1314778 RepID=A0A5C3NSL5_9APHY|nr:hypothetical protein K466DRAFT_667619 [Polyporus arcularius HHB13444]